jgi:hypothetical protein
MIVYIVLRLTSVSMIYLKCRNLSLALQDELLLLDCELGYLTARQLQVVRLLRKTRRALLITGIVVLFFEIGRAHV